MFQHNKLTSEVPQLIFKDFVFSNFIFSVCSIIAGKNSRLLIQSCLKENFKLLFVECHELFKRV